MLVLKLCFQGVQDPFGQVSYPSRVKELCKSCFSAGQQTSNKSNMVASMLDFHGSKSTLPSFQAIGLMGPWEMLG